MRWLALALSLAGCGGWWGGGSDTVVIYSGRGQALVGDLLARASAETGVPIQVQYGSTSDLVTRVLVERELAQADLVFAQEAGHLGALVGAELLAPLPAELLARVPPSARDPEGRWIGVSGRLRTLVIHEPSVSPQDRPATLADLADPRFADKVGWAPTNASFQAHIAGLLHLWGPDRTRTWLSAVHAQRPRTFTKNGAIVRATLDGELPIGWVNHYYLHQAARDGDRAVAHSFAPGDAGNVLMLSGIGVRAGSSRAQAAHRVMGWLIEEEAQRAFAEAWEYPVHPGVSPRKGVPPLDGIGLADVPQQALGDLDAARAVLAEIGVL